MILNAVAPEPFDWALFVSLAQSVLVGVVGVVGTLFGAGAADRRADRRSREERLEKRRAELRKVAMELVAVGPLVAHNAL